MYIYHSMCKAVEFKYKQLYLIRKEFDKSFLCVVDDPIDKEKLKKNAEEGEEDKFNEAVQKAKRPSRYYLLTHKKSDQAN
jgi:hypothetical protein